MTTLLFLLSLWLQQSAASDSTTPLPVLNRDLFGVSIDRAGDLDGDGSEDLWVADPSDAEGIGTEPFQCIWAVSGAEGTCIRRIPPPEGAKDFGSSVRAVGDIDGDGVSDVASACWFFPTTELPKQTLARTPDSPLGEGAVFFFSGATGELLHAVSGPADWTKLSAFAYADGPTLCAVGDWNRDGAGDLAVGWAFGDSDTVVDCGRVDVVSGRDGSRLQSWYGSGSYDRLGTSLCKLDDLDGDELPELAACAFPVWESQAGPEHPLLAKERSGYLQVLSSKGVVRQTFRPQVKSRSFGLSLARYPDADGDGVEELLVGSPFSNGSNDIRMLSPKKGSLLRRFEEPFSLTWATAGRETPPPPLPGPPPRNFQEAMDRDPRHEHVGYDFGTRLLAIPDRDGDGRADVLVTIAEGGGFMCTAYAGALSSKTGKPIALVPHLDDVSRNGERQCLNYLGLAVCALPDMDGDDVDDFAIGGGSGLGLVCPGAVVLCSGKDFVPFRFILSTDLR